MIQFEWILSSQFFGKSYALCLALQELRDVEKTVMPQLCGLWTQKTFDFSKHVTVLFRVK
jgi:hypothetical protein